MSLRKYKSKRDFEITPEPKGRPARAKSDLIFVVQEHHARRLHFDLRLEAGGTLKSWAIPKGPPQKPGDKRLAVQVEDHPLDYASFEGEIPAGEYGAGQVSIWDRGTWTPPPAWRKDLKKGHLEFELHGAKLQGKWILIRLKNDRTSWLLIKRKDQALRVLSARSGKPAPFPSFVAPQLAVLVDNVPVGPDWIHEIKYDGYRTLARIDEGDVQLLTRTGRDWTEKYGPVSEALRKLDVKRALLDGEIAWIDDQGRSDFQGLQQALSSRDYSRIVYYVFDLLYLNGQNLMDRPLIERKAMLKALMAEKIPRLVYSEHWTSGGQAVFLQSCKQKLEGIVSKDSHAAYRSGREPTWQKIKCGNRQEFVIVGYSESASRSRPLAALLMGVHDSSKRLRFIGKVGTGFSDRMLRDLHRRLTRIEIARPAVSDPPREKRIHWVEPVLVGEVEYKTWTSDGMLRQASFQGLRADKSPRAVTLEKPKHAEPAFEGVTITHPARVLYPKTGATKLDLVSYYHAIAPWILPHLINRPLSLVRCPDTEMKGCFFQKHLPNRRLVDVKSRPISHDGKKDTVITIDSISGLMSLMQWGALEIHTWGSRMPRYSNPDLIVLDLDPETPALWNEVITTARLIRRFLKELKLESFVKVTGGKGLHIHVPIEPTQTWDEVKTFSRSLMQALADELPSLYTLNMSLKKRGGKIFLDYLRNGFGATAIAPYGVRARTTPSIAFPVAWSSLKTDLAPDSFTYRDVLRLITSRKDPWEDYFSIRQALPRAGIAPQPERHSDS